MNNKCTEELTKAGAHFEAIVLTQSVHSVSDVEKACGCQAAEVIKTLLFIGNAPVMAILPGDKKADVEKLKTLLHESSLRMATKEEVFSLTGYTVGSVSPFGIDSLIKKVADQSILSLPFLIMGSGKSDTLIKLNQSEFSKSFQGITALISV